ncbi:MAG: helix-turn-helix domain-containing protein [Alteromonadaceae bacterium]|nr:helix-turn-helix domain-containing protein [Alteromonadaceae bacterium]
MQLSQVPTFYLPQIKSTLQENGVLVKDWLVASGLTEEQIAVHQGHIPVNKYLSLINNAVRMSKLPDIGLQVGNKLNIGSHGLLGFSLLNCQDLEQALDLLERYLCTRTPILKVHVERADDEVRLVLNVPNYVGEVYRSFIETATLGIYNLVNYLIPNAEAVTAVSFDYAAPSYSTAYAKYFDCATQFSAPICAITLNPEIVHRHFATDDPIALQQAKVSFEAEKQALQALSWDNNVTDKIYNLLYQERHHFPDLEDIAAKLCITSRTLHRRLVAEGSSFRQILHAVKAKLARQYLATSLHTVADISDLLGYDNVANFRRAFKQWEGVTPQQFRQDVHNEHTLP